MQYLKVDAKIANVTQEYDVDFRLGLYCTVSVVLFCDTVYQTSLKTAK